MLLAGTSKGVMAAMVAVSPWRKWAPRTMKRCSRELHAETGATERTSGGGTTLKSDGAVE